MQIKGIEGYICMFSNAFRILGLISLCAALTACIDDKKMADYSTALKAHPELVTELVNRCINSKRLWTADSQAGLATIVTTADSRNKRAICERLYKGIASGRLTATDLQSFGDEYPTANAIRILQGR